MIYTFEAEYVTLPNPAHPQYKGKFQFTSLSDDIFEATDRARREINRSALPKDVRIEVKLIGSRAV
jgi:hypothetical protein